jgi:hypothetical protein
MLSSFFDSLEGEVAQANQVMTSSSIVSRSALVKAHLLQGFYWTSLEEFLERPWESNPGKRLGPPDALFLCVLAQCSLECRYVEADSTFIPGNQPSQGRRCPDTDN